jgi:hypothetical protein
MAAMNVGQFMAGLGLAAFGIAFVAIARWHVRDDARMRKLAQSRWWFDRRVERKIRRGEMLQEEWFDAWIRSQRWLVKWGFSAALVLWLAICVVAIVHSVSVG